MKHLTAIILLSAIVLISMPGCDDSSTSTESGSVDEAMALLDEIAGDIETVSTSKGAQCMGLSPELQQANTAALFKASVCSDMLSDYFYLLLAPGTYIIDATTAYTYAPYPADEVVLRFPYTDAESGTVYDAIWRYHDIQLTDTELKVSFQVLVDFTEYVHFNFIQKGSGFSHIADGQAPQVTLNEITGFFIDDNDQRCDARFYTNSRESGIRLKTAEHDTVSISVVNIAIPNRNAKTMAASDYPPGTCIIGSFMKDFWVIIMPFDFDLGSQTDIGLVTMMGEQIGRVDYREGQGLWVVYTDGREESFSATQEYIEYLNSLNGGDGAYY